MTKDWAIRLFGLLIVLGTIIFVPLPSFGFVLPKLLFYSAAGLAGLLIISFAEKPESLAPLYKTQTGKLFLSFFAIVLISPLWSKAPLLSFVGSSPRFEGLMAYFVFFAIALSAFAFARRKRNQSYLIKAIVLSNAFVILYGSLQVLGIDPFIPAWDNEVFLGRTFSTLGQPNFLGLFILLTLPFAFNRMQESKDRPRAILSSLCLLNLLVLATTASRSALIGFLIVFAIVVVRSENWKKQIKASNRILLNLTSIALFLILISAVLEFSERFSSPTQHIGLGSRAVIWDASADMFIHRPVGYGLDSMALFSPQFIDKEIFEYEPLETVVDRAHSKPFDLFITLGILGFLAYYTLLTKHLHSLWKRREEPIVITSFLSLLGASICLLFSFDTAVTHVFFWMIMGLSLGATLPTRKTKKPRLECSIYLGSAFLVLISVIAFSQWNGARFRSFQSIRLFNDGYLNDYLKPGQRAVYLFPFDRSILISNAQNMISEQSWLSASANANFDDIERRGQLQDSVRSTLKLHSFLTSNNDGIGDLLSAWNESLRFLDFESKVVDDLIHEALYKNPMHVPTLRTGVLIYNSIGMHEHSVSMINKVIEVLPDFFYDDKSERRRILLKENKWLLELL